MITSPNLGPVPPESTGRGSNPCNARVCAAQAPSWASTGSGASRAPGGTRARAPPCVAWRTIWHSGTAASAHRSRARSATSRSPCTVNERTALRPLTASGPRGTRTSHTPRSTLPQRPCTTNPRHPPPYERAGPNHSLTACSLQRTRHKGRCWDRYWDGPCTRSHIERAETRRNQRIHDARPKGLEPQPSDPYLRRSRALPLFVVVRRRPLDRAGDGSHSGSHRSRPSELGRPVTGRGRGWRRLRRRRTSRRR